jgi:hypothetical protein
MPDREIEAPGSLAKKEKTIHRITLSLGQCTETLRR